MTAFCRKTKTREKITAGITKYLPDLLAAAYPAAIVVLLVQGPPWIRLLKFILVPLAALIDVYKRQDLETRMICEKLVHSYGFMELCTMEELQGMLRDQCF